jgi:hypothetical protein
MADSSYPKHNREDALIIEIRRVASRTWWTFNVTGGTVRFDDGVAETEVTLDDLAADFEQTMHRVAARLSEASAAPRPVPRRQETYYSAPWHEFDRSGYHISDKSG